MCRCVHARCGPCAFGAITVAAHELEYEAQKGMQTRFVRSMIRVRSWDSVQLGIILYSL